MAIEWQAPAHDIPHAEGAATVEALRAIAEQLEQTNVLIREAIDNAKSGGS